LIGPAAPSGSKSSSRVFLTEEKATQDRSFQAWHFCNIEKKNAKRDAFATAKTLLPVQSGSFPRSGDGI
jgi:hypothetical protein